MSAIRNFSSSNQFFESPERTITTPAKPAKPIPASIITSKISMQPEELYVFVSCQLSISIFNFLDRFHVIVFRRQISQKKFLGEQAILEIANAKKINQTTRAFGPWVVFKYKSN